MVLELGVVDEREYYVFKEGEIHKIVCLIVPDGNIDTKSFVEVEYIGNSYHKELGKGVEHLVPSETKLQSDYSRVLTCHNCGSESEDTTDLKTEWMILPVYLYNVRSGSDSEIDFIESEIQTGKLSFKYREFCGNCLDRFDSDVQNVCGQEFRAKILSEQL